MDEEYDESVSERELVEDSSRDTEASKRRLTRSAILTASNAPSPEVTTGSSSSSSSSDQKVLLNLRLDIGSSLAALFSTTTPSTFSTIFTTSSPYFVSEFEGEPQTVQPTEPIDAYDANGKTSAPASMNKSAINFLPVSDSSITSGSDDEEVSSLPSESPLMETPTTKSPSDINQAPLVDFTTTVLSALSNSPNLLLNPSESTNNSVNLELATSHRETSINVPLQQNKLSSQVNFTKDTQETVTLLPTMATIKRQTTTSTSSSPSSTTETASIAPGLTVTPPTTNGIVVTSQSTYKPQEQLHQQQQRQQQLRGQVLQGETASQSAQVNGGSSAIVVPNLPSWATENKSISSNHGSNLGSMDTARDKTNDRPRGEPPTKMATSDPGLNEKGGEGYNQQKQHHFSTLLPIALILSSPSNNGTSESSNLHNSQLLAADVNDQIGNKQATEGTSTTKSSSWSNGTTMTTPANGSVKDHQTPKSPAVAAVEIITTEIVMSPYDEQTSAPSSSSTLTASNYEPGKSSDSQSALNQPTGPSDESSSTSSKLTPLVELTTTTTSSTSTVVVPSSHSSTSTTTTTVKPAELPVALAHSGTKKPSSINDPAAFATSDDTPIASSLPLVGKTSPNGPLGSPDISDSYDFKPVRDDSLTVVKKNDSATASSAPHLQFKPPANPGPGDASPPPSISSSPSSPSSPSSSGGDESSHWSLRESLVVCKNVKSARVMADVLRNMKGYHFNNIILDDVRLPNPFPFALFSNFSFDFLELLQVSSLQFTDNFSDKSRDYFYGRSSKGVKINSPSSPSPSSSPPSSSSTPSNPVKSEPSQGFTSSTGSWWKK